MKPATPLPWKEHRDADARTGHLIVGGEVLPGATRQPAIAKISGKGNYEDAAYIVHAANLYGPLVEALRALDPNHPVLKQAGEA